MTKMRLITSSNYRLTLKVIPNEGRTRLAAALSGFNDPLTHASHAFKEKEALKLITRLLINSIRHSFQHMLQHSMRTYRL
jgi:hypothetical protein